MRKTPIALFLITMAIATQAMARAATGYPERPIQLVVPDPAGGAVDAVARLLQNGMERQLGEPVLVVNRPGGNTIVGTEYVAHAYADGYTIAMVSLPHVANFTLFKHMPYSQNDFASITEVTNTRMFW